MPNPFPVTLRRTPVLDPGFVPAVLWNRAYERRVEESGESVPIAIALEQPGGSVALRRMRILAPSAGEVDAASLFYVERILKFLLWQKGGSRVHVGGCPELADALGRIYSAEGSRAFDFDFIGRRIYGEAFTVRSCGLDEVPGERDSDVPLGRHLEGCRIGFDLGGSDRKCAAVVDGEVVFSEEVPWDPYFQSDPAYHLEGIHDSLRRAAEKLPRVDAIGGSAAGVYVGNEVRAGSLFRGVSEEDFERHVRRIFFTLRERWGGVPFEVVNDGEVTALAGSMSLDSGCVLGISMGTSLAAGYVDAAGNIKPWLNELAFSPIDYRDGAPLDEWSGDHGCGVQYFSQQGVARLAPAAGFAMGELPFPEQLIKVQEAMKAGDERARRIYQTIGTCFGYAVAHYADFYEIRKLLILGRVTSGEGGNVIIREANAVLRDEFPDLAGSIEIRTPDEQMKRHGQAVAAASLPSLVG